MSSVHIRQREIPELDVALHDNVLLHRILAARGITDKSQMSCSLADLPRPDALPDIDRAVSRLLRARDAGEHILIVGDYDCDGATSTAVATLGLQSLGFNNLEYLIPSRFKDGYGLSPAIVDMAYHEFNASLIVTVDNGVASVDGVSRAREYGIDVVVTDHHLAPRVLPDAYAIVNPTLPDAEFDGCNLAGVGVIFYTLLAVRARLKALNDPLADAPLQDLLDLVAIGTVADVVPLDTLNRTLVEQGLRRIRAGKTRPGVLALLDAARRPAKSVSAQDIGFSIGPRLNAAGRMDDMRVGVQCLLSESQADAATLAKELNRLNVERRGIQSDMQERAMAQLEALDVQRMLDNGDQCAGKADHLQFALCLMDESWHEGVIGILAGRIKEMIYKPVVVFTADDGDNLKGSARSIAGVHIRDVLQNVATRHPGMISRFGGHAMAAGLTLPRSSFKLFNEVFNECVGQMLQGQPSVREYLTDGSLSEAERSMENALLLQRYMPWGQSFEAPVFDDVFIVIFQKVVGKTQAHLKLSLQAVGSDQTLDAIAFNQSPQAEAGDRVHVIYTMDVNTYRGAHCLQLLVQHYEPCALRQSFAVE